MNSINISLVVWIMLQKYKVLACVNSFLGCLRKIADEILSENLKVKMKRLIEELLGNLTKLSNQQYLKSSNFSLCKETLTTVGGNNTTIVVQNNWIIKIL